MGGSGKIVFTTGKYGFLVVENTLRGLLTFDKSSFILLVRMRQTRAIQRQTMTASAATEASIPSISGLSILRVSPSPCGAVPALDGRESRTEREGTRMVTKVKNTYGLEEAKEAASAHQRGCRSCHRVFSLQNAAGVPEVGMLTCVEGRSKIVAVMDAEREIAYDAAAAHGRGCRTCGRWAAGCYAHEYETCETGATLAVAHQQWDEALWNVPEAAHVAAGL